MKIQNIISLLKTKSYCTKSQKLYLVSLRKDIQEEKKEKTDETKHLF